MDMASGILRAAAQLQSQSAARATRVELWRAGGSSWICESPGMRCWLGAGWRGPDQTTSPWEQIALPTASIPASEGGAFPLVAAAAADARDLLDRGSGRLLPRRRSAGPVSWLRWGPLSGPFRSFFSQLLSTRGCPGGLVLFEVSLDHLHIHPKGLRKSVTARKRSRKASDSPAQEPQQRPRKRRERPCFWSEHCPAPVV